MKANKKESKGGTSLLWWRLSPEHCLRGVVAGACAYVGRGQASKNDSVFQFAVGSDADGNTIHIVLPRSRSDTTGESKKKRWAGAIMWFRSASVAIGSSFKTRASATLLHSSLSLGFVFHSSSPACVPLPSAHPFNTHRKPSPNLSLRISQQEYKKETVSHQPSLESLSDTQSWSSLSPLFFFFFRYVAMSLTLQSVSLCISSSSSYQRSVTPHPRASLLPWIIYASRHRNEPLGDRTLTRVSFPLHFGTGPHGARNLGQRRYLSCLSQPF